MYKKLLNIQIREAFGNAALSASEERFIRLVQSTYANLVSDQLLMEALTRKMIDDLNRTNEELKQANESLDGFNYHVSHDLKTSFMNAIGLTDMLEKYLDSQDRDKLREIVYYLRENADRSLRAIEQFLDISRMHNELSSRRKEICYLPGIFTALLFNIPDLQEEQVSVDKEAFETVFFHELSLRSIFLNLLSNSSKYRNPDVPLRVRISCRFIEDVPAIIFEDNGIGMNLEAEGDKVFQLFRRLTNSRGIPGDGVGLYLVKKIMEANKGSIELFSEVGKGTRVILKFDKHAVEQ